MAQQSGKFEGAIVISMVFHLPPWRPTVQPIVHHTKTPKLSTLIRATKDAMRNVLYHDDAQIVRLEAAKLYAGGHTPPCVRISLHEEPPTILNRSEVRDAEAPRAPANL